MIMKINYKSLKNNKVRFNKRNWRYNSIKSNWKILMTLISNLKYISLNRIRSKEDELKHVNRELDVLLQEKEAL